MVQRIIKEMGRNTYEICLINKLHWTLFMQFVLMCFVPYDLLDWFWKMSNYRFRVWIGLWKLVIHYSLFNLTWYSLISPYIFNGILSTPYYRVYKQARLLGGPVGSRTQGPETLGPQKQYTGLFLFFLKRKNKVFLFPRLWGTQL